MPCVLALLLLVVGVPLAALGEDSVRIDLQMDNVFFRSGTNMVHAFVYKPQGSGKFPTVIYNQATRDPYFAPGGLYPFEAIAKWCTTRKQVLFIPDRPGHETLGKDIGEYAALLDDTTNLSRTNRMLLNGFDLIGKDILAGINWLTNQAYVDTNKMAMIGHSTGAMQSLLLSTKDTNIRGIVVFSPGAKMWPENDMIRSLLSSAVKRSKVPILLIQAQNDFSLGPSQDLAPFLREKGSPSGVRIYPPFGTSPTQAIMFAVHGTSTWGDDVGNFLDDISK